MTRCPDRYAFGYVEMKNLPFENEFDFQKEGMSWNNSLVSFTLDFFNGT